MNFTKKLEIDKSKQYENWETIRCRDYLTMWESRDQQFEKNHRKDGFINFSFAFWVINSVKLAFKLKSCKINDFFN